MNTGADAGRGKDPQDRLLPEWDAALISSFPSYLFPWVLGNSITDS